MDWTLIVPLAAAPAILVGLWYRDVIRPGSLERARGRDVGGIPAWAWLGLTFAVFGAGSLGAVAGGLVPEALRGSSGGARDEAVRLAVTYGAALAICAGVLRVVGGAAPGAGLLPRWGDVPRGVGALLLAVPVLMLVGLVSVWVTREVTGARPPVLAHPLLERIVEGRRDPWVWVLVVTAVVGAPVLEEVLYRLMLGSAVLRALGSPTASVLVTSALFALAHRAGAEPVPWHAMPTLLALGLALGIAYERTGRAGVPMVMHAGFNAVNIALALGAS